MTIKVEPNSALVKKPDHTQGYAYEFSEKPQLANTIRELIGDTVKDFKPTWWTEDWANLRTANNGSFSFRFDKDSYIATVIISHEGSFIHHAENKWASTAQKLIPKIPNLSVKTGSNHDVSDAMRRLIGNKQISDLTISLGNATEPDAVRIQFDDGSFVMCAFQAKSLIAIEHIGQDNAKRVYAILGKDASHRRIDLLASAAEGEDVIYRQAQSAPVFEIKLPSLTTFLMEK